MYIDAKKFKYSEPLSSKDKAKQDRDRHQAAKSYRTWVQNHCAEMVERLWEIDDIGVVEQVGAFVQLLKEAEFTYSLGVYRSAIALVGISAEDLCRFFADLSGHNLDHLNQYDRINQLEALGLIPQPDAALFHRIRRIRNDCLHFNASFKAKSDAALKAEALSTLNDAKKIYANLIGVTAYNSIDGAKLAEITTRIAEEASRSAPDGSKDLNEVIMRTRNVFAAVTGVDLSLDLGGRPIVTWSLFRINAIDLDGRPPEIDLVDLKTGMIVIVDLTEKMIEAVTVANLSEGQTVFAAIISMTNEIGLTAEWRFVSPPVPTAM